MGSIEWISIEDLPEDFKDGREVLFFFPEGGGHYGPVPYAPTAVGMRYDGSGWGAYYGGCDPWGRPTHFAEINAPDQILRGSE